MNEKHYEILSLLQSESLDTNWHRFVYCAWEKSFLFDGVDDFNKHLHFLENNGLIDIDTANGQYFVTASGFKLYHQGNTSIQDNVPLDDEGSRNS